jgi:hypothetical protein
MLNAIKSGAGAGAVGSKCFDHSRKSILARGCDPVMAAKSMEFLPKMLNNVQITAVTDDEDFLKLIEGEHRFTAVFFAPGACRYDAARQPIPGGNDRTKGWSLEKYREFVKEHQGETISIIETQEESQIIPLLAQALADADAATNHNIV